MQRNYNLERLRTATKETCPLFSFEGIVTYAKAVDIYDGDTFNIIISWYDALYHFKARMYGYDSPEMKPPLSASNRDEIKAKAIKAKDRLWNLLNQNTDGLFVVYCHEFDKYGRILVSVLPNEITKEEYKFENTINQRMINEGHGYSYYGGTKQK